MQWSRAIVREFAMVRRVCLSCIGRKFSWLLFSHFFLCVFRWHKMWECARYFLELAISCGLCIIQANIYPGWRSVRFLILFRHWRKTKMLSSTWSEPLNLIYLKFICYLSLFLWKIGGASRKVPKQSLWIVYPCCFIFPHLLPFYKCSLLQYMYLHPVCNCKMVRVKTITECAC